MLTEYQTLIILVLAFGFFLIYREFMKHQSARLPVSQNKHFKKLVKILKLHRILIIPFTKKEKLIRLDLFR